jgi:hypothetical protein
MPQQHTSPTLPPDRLWSKVSKSETCWLWTGLTDRKGYGQITVRGDAKRNLGTHRIAWWLATGYWPTSDEPVCHDCPGGDNPLCVRNDDEGWYEVGGVLYPKRGHLWLGTIIANNLDMVAKGTAVGPPHLIGADNPKAKITEADVIAIRVRYATGVVLQEQLATEYGIARPHIGNIVRGESWAHAGGPITEGRMDANPDVTPEMILAVRAAAASGYPSQRALSREWCVARSVIRTIIEGRFDR